MYNFGVVFNICKMYKCTNVDTTEVLSEKKNCLKVRKGNNRIQNSLPLGKGVGYEDSL